MFLDRKSRNARHGWTRQDGALRSGLGRLPSDTLSTMCGRVDLAGLAVYGAGGAGLATITPHAIALMIFRRSSFAITFDPPVGNDGPVPSSSHGGADRVGVRHSPALRFPAVREQGNNECRPSPSLKARAWYPPVKIKNLLMGKSGQGGFNGAAGCKSITADGPRDTSRVAVGTTDGPAGRRTSHPNPAADR
jgi:hypothetical protein